MDDSNMYLIALLMRGLGYDLDDYNLILTGTPEDFERAEARRNGGIDFETVIAVLLDELRWRK